MAGVKSPLVISLMFCLDTEQGHIYTYNLSLGHAVRTLGWDHIAAVRAAAHVKVIPPGWHMCLGYPDTPRASGLLQKGRKLGQLVRTLNMFLRQQERDEHRPMILFLEWFDPVHLIAFCLALLGLPMRTQFSTWILYRLAMYGPRDLLFFRLVHGIIRARLGKDRLTLLSDSEIVAKALFKSMGLPVYTVPIPHGALSPDEPIESPRLDPCNTGGEGQLTCWWPGQPAPLKGLAVIEHLTHLSGAPAKRLRIVAAEGSGLTAQPDGCDVTLIPDVLTRPQYVGWLKASDIILLPYDPTAYAERTSGIFCEAVSAGKLAAVTDGTWMSDELRRHDLSELIVNWYDTAIVDRLVYLYNDPEVRRKLDQMRVAYNGYHTIQGLAHELERIYDETCHGACD
jgi:hypothetical protein